MEETIKCLIIGSGPAGYTAAIYTSRANLQPVLYEGIEPGGQLTTTTDVENFPGYPDGVSGQQMMADMRRQAERFGTEIRTGTATRVDLASRPFHVVIDGTTQLKAETLIIATGASAKYLGLPSETKFRGMGVSACATCDGFFYRKKDVAVVGGGYIGLEFASMYASFGSKVTVLEGFAELIPREDRDIAAAVREALEKKGIEFRMGARVESVSDTAGGVRVAVADTQTGGKYEIVGDAVLLATGRRPATAGLNLAAAGIETDDRGAVRVDAHLRTTAPRVFAAGDVTGGLQFTYVSLDDFRIIRDVLLGDGARTTANRGPVPYSVFIEPTLSHVGMHEEEARKAGRDIRVNRIAVAAFPRSRILGSTEGVLKAVIDAKTDEILGCTLFGAESGEVINTVATAMKHGVTAHDLSNSIYTHPSMSESLNDLFA